MFSEDKLWVAWLHAPRRIGAVVPSSTRLATAMAREVPLGEGLVLELGAGTGSITEQLLRSGVEPRSLVLIEQDPQLASYLTRHFPGCRVLCADACRLPQVLSDHGISGPVRAVVSSLPLLGMSPALRAKLVRGVRRLIRGRGCMLQYTYGLHCPIPPRTLKRGNLRAERIEYVWRNLPPASIWRFEHRG